MKFNICSKILLSSYCLFFLFILVRELSLYIFSFNSPYLSSMIRARTSKVECLIMGDSQTAALFRHKIGECDNLSAGGTSIPMIKEAVESVSLKNNLKFVVLGLGPHYFSSYRLKNRSEEFKGIAEFYTPNVNLIGNKVRTKQILSKYLSSLYFFERGEKEGGETILHWHKVTRDKRAAQIRARVAQHSPVNNWLETEYSKQYLELVSSLISKGVKVCVVRPPVDSEYENQIFHSLNTEDWVNYLTQLKSTGAKYIDYLAISHDPYPINELSNQDHVHEEVAEKIGRMYLNACFNR